MTRIAPATLRKYLLGGQVSAAGCLRHRGHRLLPSISVPTSRAIQALHTDTQSESATIDDAIIPLRKQLKDEAKRRKAKDGNVSKQQSLDEWELTVGIEIHAQLNTERKLFSRAASTINEAPNTHVAYFDLALPGSMPIFQKETLIPAIRGALALNCFIPRESRFDRKHYFHWDQPAGYQITQYYEPLAKNGHVTLYAHDGIAEEDGPEITIGIKQVQMEQDTAKTISQPDGLRLLDYNRVGLPLIEIISLPQIHHPSTAAAFVRKVQSLLDAADACVLGMQSGGLRADVNVSVRRRTDQGDGHEYAGVKGLGQRTEIKNLSSFKAVEDAIIAERDRQIAVLEAGGVVEGETRGWTIGSTETRRLRGKEGEVDYRYMPDPDIPPVIVDPKLINHLQKTLGVSPDEELKILTKGYGLTMKDAISLVSLNDGARVDYFRDVVDSLMAMKPGENVHRFGKLASNWVLHEMGGLVSDIPEEENPLQFTIEGGCIIPHSELAKLIFHLDQNKITGKTAKRVLNILFEKRDSVDNIIEQEGLWLKSMSMEEYEDLARSVLDMKVVEEILAGQEGKLNFLLGKMMRLDGEGRIEPQMAREVLKRIVEEHRKEGE